MGVMDDSLFAGSQHLNPFRAALTTLQFTQHKNSGLRRHNRLVVATFQIFIASDNPPMFFPCNCDPFAVFRFLLKA